MTHPTPRTIAITGAGTGIGAACARRFARRGDRVVLIGRRQAARRAGRRNGRLALAGDAASTADWARFLPRIAERFGRVDALVACAGGHGPAARTKPTTRSGATRCTRTSTPRSSARARACPT